MTNSTSQPPPTRPPPTDTPAGDDAGDRAALVRFSRPARVGDRRPAGDRHRRGADRGARRRCRSWCLAPDDRHPIPDPDRRVRFDEAEAADPGPRRRRSRGRASDPTSPASPPATRCSVSPSGRSPSTRPPKHDKLALKPSTATFEQAAASAISGITALQALTDVGKLQAGQHVLVIGASGGVGTFAVQLAKALGAQVTGVASTAKLDLVRSLGADHVVDYTREDATDGSTPVRPDHRRRRPHTGSPPPSSPDQPRNARDRRRRGRWPLDRWYRPATASDAAVAVHQTAPHDVHQQRDSFVGRAARRVHPDR